MHQVTINSRHLRAVIKAASREVTRPMLCGICVEARNRLVSVTCCDGKLLVTCFCGEQEVSDFKLVITIPPHFILQGDHDLDVKLTEDSATLSHPKGIKLEIPTIKAEYPNWRTVIPNETGAMERRIDVAPKRMKQILDSALCVSSKASVSMAARYREAISFYIIGVPERDEWFAELMPLTNMEEPKKPRHL